MSGSLPPVVCMYACRDWVTPVTGKLDLLKELQPYPSKIKVANSTAMAATAMANAKEVTLNKRHTPPKNNATTANNSTTASPPLYFIHMPGAWANPKCANGSHLLNLEPDL